MIATVHNLKVGLVNRAPVMSIWLGVSTLLATVIWITRGQDHPWWQYQLITAGFTLMLGAVVDFFRWVIGPDDGRSI